MLKKYCLLFLMVLLCVCRIFAQEADVSAEVPQDSVPAIMAVVHVKAPVTGEYREYITENPGYEFIDLPLEHRVSEYSELQFLSDDPKAYTVDDNAVLVISRIKDVTRDVQQDLYFFRMKFMYSVYRHGDLIDDYQFVTIGTGDTQEEALKKCFRNGAVNVAYIFEKICGSQDLYTISGTYGNEYILSCGSEQKIRKGDEFKVMSKRSGSVAGKLYVTDLDAEQCFAHKMYLREMALPGDTVERIKLFGLATNVYCDMIFDDGVLFSSGVYEEFFRGCSSFRPLVGIEYINADSGNMNLYAGIKSMHHVGYIDLSGLVTLGRGYTDGDFRYWGGSIKIIADHIFADYFKISVENGYTRWIADKQDDFSDYGGFLLGLGFTFRY
ncbi:MAG: hypothetical protein MJ215_07090 [Spirochaetia bacterium]|nr:hypothetical protein [Spirochaetia bacterium]